MARHPTARRVHREAPSSDDKFIEGVLEISAWAKQHSRLLTISAVVAVIAIASLIYYRNYSVRLNANAAVAMTNVRQTVLSGNQALAIRDLEAFLQQYGSTSSAGEARLLLADARIQNGQADQAVTDLQQMASDLAAPLGVPAAFLLASAHEISQRIDDAETVYLRIADNAPFLYQKERALDSLGRVRMAQDDASGAVQAYDRLVDLLPVDNPNRGVYLMRRAEAQARVSTSSG